MKTKLLLTALFVSFFASLFSQIPQGFNYQAIVKDASGTPLADQSLVVKVSINTLPSGGIVLWEEQHSIVTNQNALMSFAVGTGTRTGGTLSFFTDIPWGLKQLYLNTSVQYPGPGFTDMGTTPIWSVPYSLVARAIGGSIPKLGIVGTSTSPDSTLFEVKNTNGQTIFAVYNEGVRVYVDDGAKGAKGGFAVGGFGTQKGTGREYLRVTRDSTRINVSRPAKGQKGGFAVGGFDNSKGDSSFYLNMTPDNYFIGERSGLNNNNGKYNSFFGYEAGKSNTEGMSNVFVGYQSGLNNTVGGMNLFQGASSGYSNINGTSNVFLGDFSGYSTTGGDQGWKGSNNIFIGSHSGISNTEGGSNIFIGTYSGGLNQTGNMNIYIGDHSGYKAVGVRNTFLGSNTGENNTTGEDNILIGSQTGQGATTGDGNTIVGTMAGWKINAGNDNVFIGRNSGVNNDSGNENVQIGSGSGNGASGSRNILIGYQAGGWNAVSGSVLIGYQAGMDETNSNRLYISNSGTNSNNALIYGEFDNALLKFNGTVKVRDLINLAPRATAPSPASEGDIYYDLNTHKLKVFNGSTWMDCF